MSEELSFVEVLMIQYQPGDKEFSDFLDNEVHLFDIDYTEAIEPIEEVIQARAENEKAQQEAEANGSNCWTSLSKGYEPDMLITQPLTAFQFRCFGQNFDRGYSSGIDWEVSQMDYEYVFKPWLKQLKELGQSILSDKQAMDHPGADKVVRFITLWSYSTWQDSYYHEWDSEWELLGSIDPKQIMSAIKESEQLVIRGDLVEKYTDWPLDEKPF